MDANTIKEYVSEGKKREEEFRQLFPGKEIIVASDEEDMKEHWDLKIEGVKIDVKGLKKVQRSDEQVEQHIHWLEIKNVKGETGWCYGQADAFAFEIQDYWIIVKKEALQSYIKENVIKRITKTPVLYYLYRRKSRLDLITPVTSYDLCFIAKKMVKKPRQNVAQ
jgi:hypothetical protein